MATEHPFAYLAKRADVMRCCAQTSNLDVKRVAPDRLRATCLRCGRGHVLLRADPGSMGMFAGARKIGTA